MDRPQFYTVYQSIGCSTKDFVYVSRQINKMHHSANLYIDRYCQIKHLSKELKNIANIIKRLISFDIIQYKKFITKYRNKLLSDENIWNNPIYCKDIDNSKHICDIIQKRLDEFIASYREI